MKIKRDLHEMETREGPGRWPKAQIKMKQTRIVCADINCLLCNDSIMYDGEFPSSMGFFFCGNCARFLF